MVQRLLFMKSLLRPTGSIYLHCDPTASHYIKVMMDGIFGHQNFRNEIVWKRALPMEARRGGETSTTQFYSIQNRTNTHGTGFFRHTTQAIFRENIDLMIRAVDIAWLFSPGRVSQKARFWPTLAKATTRRARVVIGRCQNARLRHCAKKGSRSLTICMASSKCCTKTTSSGFQRRKAADRGYPNSSSTFRRDRRSRIWSWTFRQ